MSKQVIYPVADGVYRTALPTGFPIGDVHVYLLPDSDGLTLIDTGSHREDALDQLQLAISELGYTSTDVHTLVLTHGHADHVGNVKLLAQLANIQVLGHRLTEYWLNPSVQWMQKEEAFFDQLYTEADLSIEEKLRLQKERKWLRSLVPPYSAMETVAQEEMIGEWRVLYTPGHSNSSLSLFREKDRVLIAGDALIAHVSSNAFVEPDAEKFIRTPSVELFHKTFMQIKNLKPSVVLAGHGVVINEPNPLIMRRIESISRRVEQMVSLISAGHQTVRELAEALFPARTHELMLIVSEIVGHLDIAIDHQLIKQFLGDRGQKIYQI